jgi:hypothetical protein
MSSNNTEAIAPALYEVTSFKVPSEANEARAFVRQLCPNCTDKIDDTECDDPILQNLFESTRIARVTIPVLPKEGKPSDPILVCYDERNLRKWENTLEGEPFTDPATNGLLKWAPADLEVWNADVRIMLEEEGIAQDEAFRSLVATAPASQNMLTFAINLFDNDLIEYAVSIIESEIRLMKERKVFEPLDIAYLFDCTLKKLSRKMFNETIQFCVKYDIQTVETLAKVGAYQMAITSFHKMKTMLPPVHHQLFSDVWRISALQLDSEAVWLFKQAFDRMACVFDVNLIISAYKWHKDLGTATPLWHKLIFDKTCECKTKMKDDFDISRLKEAGFNSFAKSRRQFLQNNKLNWILTG